MRSMLCGVLFALLVFSARASVAPAQDTAPQPSVRVAATIVLADRLPADSRFVVRRVPGSARHDVVVLRPDATAAELTEAVNTLLTARYVEGDIPSTKRTLRIRPTGRKGAIREYPWAARVLADVRRAAPVDIPEVGNARAVEIWLPRQFRQSPPSARPRG
jgi:hypothetical protein